MNDMHTARSITRTLACVAAMLATAPSAYADANLTLTPVSSTCHSSESGARYQLVSVDSNGVPWFDWVPWTRSSSSACDPSSTNPVWIGENRSISIPGSMSSFITVVYDFTYTDDGLPLEQVERLDGVWPVTFEAGLVSVDVDGYGYTPGGPGIVVSLAVSGDALPSDGLLVSSPSWVLLGANDHPDQISGRLTINVRVAPYNTQDQAYITNINVGSSVATVAAVPEPSTYALMAIGLAAVGAATRRHRSNTACGEVSQAQAVA